jgi:hypothetical protein
MKKPLDIDKKVEETLNSLNGIQRAEGQPYFFTRVKARLERDQRNIWETAGSFMARPVVAIAGLCIILAFNMFFLLQKDNTTSPGTLADNPQQVQEDDNIFAASTTNYDYENLEP